MKSNVLLKSSSRELFGENISVMSKDGFVCITDVMEVLSKKRKEDGLEPKRLDHLFSNKGFQEKMSALIKELNVNNICTVGNPTVQNGVLEINKLIDLKKYGMAYRKGKGAGQKWFVNPYFFVVVALEMDPQIYAKVILWLTDGFIDNRNMAGDAYVDMSRSVYSIVNDKDNFPEYIKSVAKAVNYIVFGRHEEGIRNYADKNQLMEIIKIENTISGVINGGFIRDYKNLRDYLGNEWGKKWGNPILNNK